MTTLGILFYFAIPGLAPYLFQRIAMASDVGQVKQSFTYATIFQFLISAFLVWVAILLLADNPGLTKEQVFPYLVKTYAHTGLKGLFSIGVIAMAMSTADSCLNSAAVMLTNDIAIPLKITKHNPLLMARLCSLLLGSVSLFIALVMHNILDIVLLSGSFYMPILTVPMLLAVFGFRSTPRAVLIGIAAGFSTVTICLIYFKSVNGIVPGMIANLIGLLGSHYLLREQGGWQRVAGPLALAREAKQEAWKRRVEMVRSFKLYHYLQQNLPKQEYFYLLFGFYLFASSYASLYTLSDTITKQYQSIHEVIQYSMLMIITGFILHPLWPQFLRSKSILTWIWPLSIGYAMFFVGGMLFIMNGLEQVQMMMLMLNLVMTVLLIRWPLALILAASGGLAAVCFLKTSVGLEAFPTTPITLQFKVIYGLLLFSSFSHCSVQAQGSQGKARISECIPVNY